MGNDPMALIEYESAPVEIGRSWPGVASFVMGLVVWVILFVLIGVMTALTVRSGGMVTEDMVVKMGATLLVCGGCSVSVVGTGLGIWSLFQPGKKRLFGVLGLVLNGLIVVGVLGMVIVSVLL